MNKDMIFDADGQAAQTELKDQRKRSSQIYDKNLCNRYKCTDSGTVCNKKALSQKGVKYLKYKGNSK